MSNEITLDLHYVQRSFQQSLKEDDDILIDAYIEGYNELVKEGEHAIYYESFKKMMKYEKETSLHEKNGFVSGSRTMLRLHRGLDFIRLFLKRLSESEDVDNTCTTCQCSYNETLAEFHPWYIRKAATLAMHALPNRHDLLKKIFGSEETLAESLSVLPQMLSSCDEVYQRVEQLYTDFDFHGLP